MKVIKGQLETSLTAMKRQNVFSSICRVFWPFQMQIVGRQFNVYVGRINSMNEMGSAPEINAIDAMDSQGLYADWTNYELVLYNMI